MNEELRENSSGLSTPKEEGGKYNSRCNAVLLSQMGDIPFEITPCFSLSTFFPWVTSCNSMRLKFLSPAQTSP